MPGITKATNGYQRAFGALYDEIPKSVFAAVALSFAYISIEEKGFDEAARRVIEEWRTLFENGIVPQKPPKGPTNGRPRHG